MMDRKTISGLNELEGIGHWPPTDLNTLRATWIDGRYTKTFIAPIYPATSGSYVQLNIDPCDGNLAFSNKGNIALSPTQFMKFYYDNDGTYNWLALYRMGATYNNVPRYSEAMAAIYVLARLYIVNPTNDSLGLKRNWSGYKLLKISFYGDHCNTFVSTDKLYVGLKDDGGTLVIVSNSDSNILKLAGWHY